MRQAACVNILRCKRVWHSLIMTRSESMGPLKTSFNSIINNRNLLKVFKLPLATTLKMGWKAGRVKIVTERRLLQ